MRALLFVTVLLAVFSGIARAGGLPAPTGRYPVGFRSFELHDPSRTNAPASADAPRALPAFIFYPSRLVADPPRPYLADADLVIAAMARNFHYDAAALSALKDARAHSVQDAPPAKGRFPVVFFSHGFPVYALQSTALLEDLASHGYVVIVITHPGDSADFRLADGRVIRTFEAPKQEEDAYRPAKHRVCCAADFADRVAAIPEFTSRIAPTRDGASAVSWRLDQMFALQSVYDGAVPRPIAEVLKHADLNRIALTGMSFGGSTAAGTCHYTPLCKAAINLDGWFYDTTMFDQPIHRPLLIVHSDWVNLPIPESRFPADYHPDDLQFERWRDAGLSPDIYRVRIKNIRHMALSDLPYLMQGRGHDVALGTADPRRSGEALSRLCLAFLDAYLKGKPRGIIANALARNSDTLDRHDPKALRDWARRNPALADMHR